MTAEVAGLARPLDQERRLLICSAMSLDRGTNSVRQSAICKGPIVDELPSVEEKNLTAVNGARHRSANLGRE